MEYKRWNRVFEGVVPDVYYFEINYAAYTSNPASVIRDIVAARLEKFSDRVTIDSVKLAETGVNAEIRMHFSMKESEFDLFTDMGVADSAEIQVNIDRSMTNKNLVDIIRQHSSREVEAIFQEDSSKNTQRVIFKVQPEVYSGDVVKTLSESIDISRVSLTLVNKSWNSSFTGYKSTGFDVDKLDSLFTESDENERSRLFYEIGVDISNMINTDESAVLEYITNAISNLNITVTPKNLKDYTTKTDQKFYEIENQLDNAKSKEEKENAIVALLDLEIELGANMRQGYIEQPVASEYIMKLYDVLGKHNISNEEAERLVKRSKYYKGD